MAYELGLVAPKLNLSTNIKVPTAVKKMAPSIKLNRQILQTRPISEGLYDFAKPQEGGGNKTMLIVAGVGGLGLLALLLLKKKKK